MFISKIAFLIFVSIAFSLNCWGQDTVWVKKPTEQGMLVKRKKEGEWLYFFEGKLHKKVNYYQGLHHGKFIRYDLSDRVPPLTVRMETNYYMGELEGWAYDFYDGIVIGKGFYKNGKQHGQFSEYLTDGRLVLIENYVEGKKHGQEISFTSTGDTIKILHYSDGLIDGIQKIFKNGKLYKIGVYCQEFKTVKKNIPISENEWAVVSEIEYQEDGKWLTFDESGNIIAKECWQCGVLIPCKKE